MFKCVEIFCLLGHARDFAPYGWTNARLPFELHWFCGKDILIFENFI